MIRAVLAHTTALCTAQLMRQHHMDRLMAFLAYSARHSPM